MSHVNRFSLFIRLTVVTNSYRQIDAQRLWNIASISRRLAYTLHSDAALSYSETTVYSGIHERSEFIPL